MKFLLSEIRQGLFRNLSMVVSVILVTFISLTFVGTASLLQLQIGQMKNYWYDRAQVAIYLCSEVSPADVCPQGEASDDLKAAVEEKLNSPTLAAYVEKYYFEDHDQAYATFQEQFKDNAVAKYVSKNQLNETFWVKLEDSTQSQIIAESFGGVAGVEEVRDQRTYLDQIFSILNAASIASIGVAVLMLFSAALLISTTIRLSAFSRRRELGIMRLVGASNFYIQLPFILEGVVAATIGSVLAGGAVLGIVQFFVQGYLAERLPFTSFVTLADGLLVVPLLIAAGIVLAAGASGLAIRRYLRI
ncbi:permease-like cell division protein FtsX [Rhodoluna sp. KAS3]|jgi:cell division transport system permease protein|uniref:permease-like cell division protein FtsX n=1 Tax=Rhodoluna sp. KAS3 TaxID=942880 RepID=UPI00222E0E76|nr:permease-like cell division protein FtsX [Rhodoluna sp. KAS3]BDS49288.1 cell division protein FtsX [Rhodoluna sp. KAS3]